MQGDSSKLAHRHRHKILCILAWSSCKLQAYSRTGWAAVFLVVLTVYQMTLFVVLQNTLGIICYSRINIPQRANQQYQIF